MCSTPHCLAVVLTIATALAALQLPVATTEAAIQSQPFVARSTSSSVAFVRSLFTDETQRNRIVSLRGGSASGALDLDVEADEIESSDEEDHDEEESEVEVITPDPKLVKAAQAASAKLRAKAAKRSINASKAAITSTLLAKKSSPKKSILTKFKLPYIIKAFLNPFVLAKMTRGYWESLFNFNYLDNLKVRSRSEA